MQTKKRLNYVCLFFPISFALTASDSDSLPYDLATNRTKANHSGCLEAALVGMLFLISLMLSKFPSGFIRHFFSNVNLFEFMPGSTAIHWSKRTWRHQLQYWVPLAHALGIRRREFHKKPFNVNWIILQTTNHNVILFSLTKSERKDVDWPHEDNTRTRHQPTAAGNLQGPKKESEGPPKYL